MVAACSPPRSMSPTCLTQPRCHPKPLFPLIQLPHTTPVLSRKTQLLALLLKVSGRGWKRLPPNLGAFACVLAATQALVECRALQGVLAQLTFCRPPAAPLPATSCPPPVAGLPAHPRLLQATSRPLACCNRPSSQPPPVAGAPPAIPASCRWPSIPPPACCRSPSSQPLLVACKYRASTSSRATQPVLFSTINLEICQAALKSSVSAF